MKMKMKMTYTETQYIKKILTESLFLILHSCLGVKQRGDRWMPHDLSEEKKLVVGLTDVHTC